MAVEHAAWLPSWACVSSGVVVVVVVVVITQACMRLHHTGVSASKGTSASGCTETPD